MAAFHRLAIGVSWRYSPWRSVWTIGGSGLAKYWYSPRPKPCRAITTRERKAPPPS